MKKLSLALALASGLALSLSAQSSANPTSTRFRDILMANQRNMLGAAHEMPAADYGFRPTAKQWTFRHLIQHAIMANNYLCAVVTGAAPRRSASKTRGKAGLIKALSASYAYCRRQLANLSDTGLEKPVVLFGRLHTTRAGAMLVASGDWSDHYAQAAMYLRLKGLLPPSAQRGRSMPRHK